MIADLDAIVTVPHDGNQQVKHDNRDNNHRKNVNGDHDAVMIRDLQRLLVGITEKQRVDHVVHAANHGRHISRHTAGFFRFRVLATALEKQDESIPCGHDADEDNEQKPADIFNNFHERADVDSRNVKSLQTR
jgi:hypothetical protein